MKFDSTIKNLLNLYPENISIVDKLREILQQTALLGLTRHQFFEHAVFYGGTSLRILYGLDRYSEDLDFSLIKPDKEFDFNPFLKGMHQELISLGFTLSIDVRNKKSENGICSAFLKANTLIMLLSIEENTNNLKIHPDQKIQIKLEIDINPPVVHLPFESKLVKLPVPFYVNTYSIPDLFAGKMHAILCRNWQNRVKGRDWYDLIWYIQRKISLNISHLKERMIQTGHLQANEKFNIEILKKYLHEKIESIDWEKAKSDIKPFIAEKNKLDIWSTTFFHDITKDLNVLEGR